MRIDRDSLTIAYCLVALAGIGAFALHFYFGVSWYIAIPVAAVLIDGPLVLAYHLLMWQQARASEPVARMVDPVFGEITLRRHRHFWEAYIPFEPLSEHVAVFIDASESGPSDQQRELFREIGKRYAGLVPEIDAALTQHYQEYLQAFGLEEMPRFRFPSINISKSGNPLEWSIDFSTEPEDYLGHTVVLKDWQIVDVFAGD